MSILEIAKVLRQLRQPIKVPGGGESTMFFLRKYKLMDKLTSSDLDYCPINMLEKFDYFCLPAGSNEQHYLDYDKVLLYFILYSQSNEPEHEEVRQSLLFELLQE